MSGAASNRENLAKFACAFSGVVWGLYWLPLRAMNDAGIAGAWATVLFYAVPMALLLPVVVWRWRALLEGGVPLHVTGLVAGVSLALYADALLFTEVIRGILLFYLTPLWSALLARFALGEAITPMRWVAMALGFAGMIVIFGDGSGFPMPQRIGDWMGLAAGMVWAVAAVRMRADTTNDGLEFTLVYFFWGSVAAIAIALLPGFEGQIAPDWETMKGVFPWLLPVLILLVIPGSFAAMWGTPLLNPAVAAILFMTEISVGAVTAALWANEPFGLREITGIALITAAGLAEPAAQWLMSVNRKRSLASSRSRADPGR